MQRDAVLALVRARTGATRPHEPRSQCRNRGADACSASSLVGEAVEIASGRIAV